MVYNFDEVIDRSGTNAYKLDLREKIFGDATVLPLWVADMDFRVPTEVMNAITNRVNHPIFGYSVRNESFEKSVVGWLNRWHNWSVEPSSLIFAPGVVPSLVVSILAFSNPGDEVVIQTPVYPPFYSVVNDNDRVLVENKLVNNSGCYSIDFEALELQLSSAKCKLFILCNPHNPVGRVWTKEELLRIGMLCLKHNVTIVSDDIHADLTLFGHKHTPIASLSSDLAQITITCIAPSKTFNIAGLSSSIIHSDNPQMVNELKKKINGLQIHMGNLFGNIALEAAYNHGDVWLSQLITYLEGNINYVIDFLKLHFPEIRVFKPEATYLLWIDFSAWNLSQSELKKFLINKANIGLNDGLSFGEGGRGFMRMNIASPRVIIEKAMIQLLEAKQVNFS